MASKTINTILNLKDNFGKTIDKTTTKTKQFKREVKQAENQAKRMREVTVKGFKAISVGIAAAGVGLFALVNKTAESMDEIDKMSERTGITRERLQELKYAAGQSGVAFESIENGVKTLTKNMGKADEESKRMTEAFGKLKININGSNGKLKSSSELFEESITKLADMKDQTERNILGQRIFGSSWQDMIPLMNQGSGGIKALTDRARQLGLVVSEDAVKANVVFGDSLSDVKQSLGALGVKLANGVLPYLQRFFDYSLAEIPKIEPIVKNVFGKLADTINAVKDNMNWLLPVASGLLGTFIAFQVVTTITKAMNAWKKASEGLTVAQTLLNITMLANPMMQIALAIGALIAIGVLLWKNWDTIKVKAAALWEGIRTAFEPVANFFSGIWEGIKLGFKGLINFVIEGINKWINFMLTPFNLLVKAANLIPGVKIPEIKFEIPKLPQFALGTQYFKGGLAQINERGGEIVDLPNGSKVIPADKSKAMLGKGRGHVFNFYFNGNVGTEEFFNEAGGFIVKRVLTVLENM